MPYLIPTQMPHFRPAAKFTLVAVCGLYLSTAQAATFSVKVVGIADGDTLTVLTASKKRHKTTSGPRLTRIDHRIQFWNEGAVRLYGWTSEEVLGKSIELLYEGTLAFNEATSLLLNSGEWRGEIARLRRSAERRGSR